MVERLCDDGLDTDAHWLNCQLDNFGHDLCIISGFSSETANIPPRYLTPRQCGEGILFFLAVIPMEQQHKTFV